MSARIALTIDTEHPDFPCTAGNLPAMLDALGTSGSFDGDYVRDQRLVHQQAIALDSAYAEGGASPTLRPVARAALSIEQRHLSLLAYL